MTIPSVESVSGVNRMLAGDVAEPAISKAGPSAAPGSTDRLTSRGFAFGSPAGSA